MVMILFYSVEMFREFIIRARRNANTLVLSTASGVEFYISQTSRRIVNIANLKSPSVPQHGRIVDRPRFIITNNTYSIFAIIYKNFDNVV